MCRRIPLWLACLFWWTASGQSGIVKDPDGNAYSWKQMPDGRQWMTQNLQFNTSDSWTYPQLPDGGRLYPFDVAAKVCAVLGKDWRLPAREDWIALALPFGGVFNQAPESGKQAFQALMKGGISGFGAVLGGGRRPADGSFARGDAHGFYWTATETDSAEACFMNFGAGSGRLYVQPDGEKRSGFSVRCVKDKP